MSTISPGFPVYTIPMFQVIHCGGHYTFAKLRCRETIEVSLNIMSDHERLTDYLFEKKWYMSVNTREDGTLVFDALCEVCTYRMIPAEVVRETRRFIANSKMGVGLV